MTYRPNDPFGMRCRLLLPVGDEEHVVTGTVIGVGGPLLKIKLDAKTALPEDTTYRDRYSPDLRFLLNTVPPR